MKTFWAYGDTTIELYCDGKHIGTDWGHRPVYEAQAESLEAAMELPLSAWEDTGDSNGTAGASFEEGFNYNDVDEDEITLHGVYDIEEQ